MTQPFAVTMNGPHWLTMETALERVSPVAALTWFTQAEKLRQWWGPQDVEIDPVPGGAYIVSWPAIGRTMRGEIANMSDTHLVYSWAWDHEPNMPARAVIVRAREQDGGSLLTITHGPFRQGEALPNEDEDRAAHLEGWSNFLPELKRVAEGRA